ncbi:Uncharacterised protein [Mycobacteroides abscessus subsp. abscessus]|nr:Uncharacterised protein [Mycobacteroides abscessus subsp. abscessus]
MFSFRKSVLSVFYFPVNFILIECEGFATFVVLIFRLSSSKNKFCVARTPTYLEGGLDKLIIEAALAKSDALVLQEWIFLAVA